MDNVPAVNDLMGPRSQVRKIEQAVVVSLAEAGLSRAVEAASREDTHGLIHKLAVRPTPSSTVNSYGEASRLGIDFDHAPSVQIGTIAFPGHTTLFRIFSVR